MKLPDRAIYYLTQPKNVWLLSGLSLALIVITHFVQSMWQLQLLDGIWNPVQARELVASLSSDQIRGHILFTATLDVVLPLVVAASMAAIALISFPKAGRYLAMIPLIALPIDFLEGVIQVLVLTDTLDLLALKAYTSPVKSTAYLTGLIVAIVGILWCGILKLRRR